MSWSRRDAIKAKALAEAKAKAGSCPNCGADPEVDLVDVSSSAGIGFVPGTISCSVRCWEQDPDAYLRAVNAQYDGSGEA
jgi:formate dehydrogenase maturation protein FdhE